MGLLNKELGMADIPLSVNFRSRLIAELAGKLRAGESCSLIGVGNSGKSNVVRHLARTDVRQLYFGDAAPQTIYALVDCNKLAERNEQSLSALILEALHKTLLADGEPWSALAPQVDARWQVAVTTNNPAVARHNVEQTLTAMFTVGARQVIVVLDDCDELIARAQPTLLRNLRALRDDFKLQLVYVTATRQELNKLHPATPEFESFFELFSSQVMPIPPYHESDAMMMLARLASRQENNVRVLSDTEMQALYRATGGHAGMLRAAYAATQRGEHALDSDLIAQLGKRQIIKDECVKILDSLDSDEVADLYALARRQPPTHNAIMRLKRKGLVVADANAQPAIFTPLLRDYLVAKVGAQAAGQAPQIVLDPGRYVVRVDGREVSLSPTEFAIFNLLFEKHPQACAHDDLILQLINVKNDSVYGQGHPERRLNRCLAQLKLKFDPPGKTFFHAENDGWRFSASGA